MEIKILPHEHISFKKIELSETEYKNARNSHRYTPSSGINETLFDIFEPHLNKEVELKNWETKKARKDFSASLYLKFFQVLKENKQNQGSLDDVVKELDNFSENFTSRKVIKDLHNPLDFDVTSIKQTADTITEYLGISKEKFLEINENNPVLHVVAKSVLDKDVRKLSKAFNLEKEEVITLMVRNPYAMIKGSPWIIENAKQTMEILEMKDVEEFKEFVKTNPKTLTKDNFKDTIYILSDFLETDETRIKNLIKFHPYLATPTIKEIKTNFQEMKKFTNVNNNKMKQICLTCPKLMTVDYKKNQQTYNDIATKELEIPLSLFIRKANEEPKMYQITKERLERLINTLSVNLNMPADEAKSFIRGHLEMLALSPNELYDKIENNFRTLEKELNIDYDTYEEMAKVNHLLILSEFKFVSNDIKDICEYLNIDKETFTEMAKINPFIITKRCSQIEKVVNTISENMNITPEECKEMCKVEPEIATRILKYLPDDITNSANALNMTKAEFAELCKKNPKFLAVRHTEYPKLAERAEFYNSVADNDNKIDLSNPAVNSDETLFEGVLATAIASSLGINEDKKASLAEIISKSSRDLIELVIPEHRLAEPFVNYAKNFFRNNNLQSKCKILLRRI